MFPDFQKSKLGSKNRLCASEPRRLVHSEKVTKKEFFKNLTSVDAFRQHLQCSRQKYEKEKFVMGGLPKGPNCHT